jgi:adenylate cyclase
VLKNSAPKLKAGLIVVGDGKPAQSVRAFPGAIVSLDLLQQAAPGSGSINMSPDADGIVRRVPLFVSFRGRLYPSLALEALRVAQTNEAGKTPSYFIETASASDNVAAGMDPNSIVAVKIGAFEIPSTDDGQMWVRYADVTRKYSVPAWKILEGSADTLSLAGAAVFIGTSAAGLLDLRATPMNLSTPGVEVHVQAFEQMLLRDFLGRPFWTRGLELAYSVAAALALLWLFARGMPATAVAVGSIGVLFAIGLSVHAFANWQMLLDPISPMIVIAVASIAGAIGFLARAWAGVQWVPPTIGRVVAIAATSAARAVRQVIPRGGDPRD